MKIDIGSRSTTEIVVLTFTFVIAIVLLVLVGGSVLMRLIYPGSEVRNAVEAATGILGPIVGGLVGFISGRAYEQKKNGESK